MVAASMNETLAVAAQAPGLATITASDESSTAPVRLQAGMPKYIEPELTRLHHMP